MNLHKNAMITLNDISFLMVTPGNDRKRIKGVYDSIRLQYPTNEIVIIYDNNSSQEINPNDINLKEISTAERVYVSKGYNMALKECTKKYFVFIHDDTFVAPSFIENLIPHITEKQFCNFTTVEPPLFGNTSIPQRPIKDFGRDTNTFVLEEFNKFSQEYINTLNESTTESPFGGFFMAGMVSSILSVGGFDEDFQPYFHEDSDLMIRLHLAGFRFIHVLDSLVYHMVSLTSRGTKESDISYETTHKIFLNKWKIEFEYFKNYTMLQNIPYIKTPVKIIYNNCPEHIKEYLNTISEDSLIEVLVDGSKLSQQEFGYLQSLPYILQNIDGPGVYHIGSLQITHK
jgi:GT2 family glycosyltransferase